MTHDGGMLIPVARKRIGRLITVEGVTLSVAGWARLRGWRDTVIFERLRRGWDPVAAVTEPKMGGVSSLNRRSPVPLLRKAGWCLLNVQRTQLGWAIHVAAS